MRCEPGLVYVLKLLLMLESLIRTTCFVLENRYSILSLIWTKIHLKMHFQIDKMVSTQEALLQFSLHMLPLVCTSCPGRAGLNAIKPHDSTPKTEFNRFLPNLIINFDTSIQCRASEEYSWVLFASARRIN